MHTAEVKEGGATKIIESDEINTVQFTLNVKPMKNNTFWCFQDFCLKNQN